VPTQRRTMAGSLQRSTPELTRRTVEIIDSMAWCTRGTGQAGQMRRAGAR
jgi:hypothetical protein